MKVPSKSHWSVTASAGEPRLAVDDLYATAWTTAGPDDQTLDIDLGATATLGGLEVYWGRAAPTVYRFECSLDGEDWSLLCRTRHGEGGQDVFAFPPAEARFVRFVCESPAPEHGLEIVEVNLYAPSEAASVVEDGRIEALGRGPIRVPAGESITVDFGYTRSPLGALIAWGASYGVVFSAHLSDDGETFREVGRIETGDGDSDSFWWRSTTSRYLRLTVHEASDPDGAIVDELKLRVLNKDRMPIGQLERAADAGPHDLHPQSLLGRQVYWTALGEYEQAEQALFDEYGALEPRRAGPQIAPFLRIGGILQGAARCEGIRHTLAEGSLPLPSVVWAAQGVELQTRAFAYNGQARAEFRVTNRSGALQTGGLVLAVRPVQINPYWQHGGHATINAIAVRGRELWVNDRPYVAFSRDPDAVAVTDFEEGDVARLIARARVDAARELRSGSGLVSAACEFAFSLTPGDAFTVALSSPMRDDAAFPVKAGFESARRAALRAWRNKLGPRKINLGDKDVSDTVEAQTAFILVNATKRAFKPGPRNYDRTWIRDGSSQALALLWSGLIDEAKAYVLWYAERIYENGLVPPILNVDGTVNRGYGADIEFDAQGEFVGIAAEVYRISKDRAFLEAVFGPVCRATRFIEELCARSDGGRGPASRFHGLVAPSISHEGYSKPSYSYWDDYFALSAWRNCAWLASEIGDMKVAAYAKANGEAFARNLERSIRLTADCMGVRLIPGSADREDVDPTSTSIAFEPCRVEDVLPLELVGPTYDRAAARVEAISAPAFNANYSPYDVRNVNAFVSLKRFDDAFRLMSTVLKSRRPLGWRSWAEVVWSDPRAPDYIGDMPHTWIGAEFSTAVRRMLVREHGDVLELFRAVPDSWWDRDGIALRQLPSAFGAIDLRARREPARASVELSLTGPPPALVTFRYPGMKHARADGKPCEIVGDTAVTSCVSRLEIDF